MTPVGLTHDPPEEAKRSMLKAGDSDFRDYPPSDEEIAEAAQERVGLGLSSSDTEADEYALPKRSGWKGAGHQITFRGRGWRWREPVLRYPVEGEVVHSSSLLADDL